MKGLKSIEISPAININPSLSDTLPIDYEAIDPADIDEYGNYKEVLNSNNMDPGLYTIKVTPGSEWYAYDAENGEFGAKGQTVTFELDVQADDPTIQIEVADSGDYSGTESITIEIDG